MSQQPLVATWFEHTALSSSSSACVATHDSESGKSHYILGIAASADIRFPGNSVAYPPETVEVTLSHGDIGSPTIIMQVSFQGMTQWADTTYHYSDSPGGQPLVMNFPAPIMVPVDVDVNIKVDCQGSSTSVNQDANIWGFTASTRVEFE